MHAYMRMYTQFGCGRSSCYARRGRNGAKGKRACRSACARSRARQSPCRGAGAHGEGPKAPARVKAVKVPYNAATKQHQRQQTDSATDKRNGSADPFLLVLFFIDFCCNFCVFNALFYMFFMRFLCVFRALSAPCGFIAFVSVRHFTYISTYQRVSGLVCRSDMHQRGRSFLANFSLPAI